jgi:adenosylmethionine-8-amino-7-oxononanoate aminotransferase
LAEFKTLPVVGDVRQQGFMVGVELVADKETKAPFPPQDKMGIRVILEARNRGVIIRPLGDVIVIMSPLGITAGELEELVDVIYQSIQTVIAT